MWQERHKTPAQVQMTNMHLPIAHTCKTSQRTSSFLNDAAEAAVVLHEKSLLLLNRSNRASRAFLNVASFQNFLKMGMEVCCSLMVGISSIQTHLSEILIYTEEDIASTIYWLSPFLTGKLMIHHQGNECDYFTLQLLLKVHHCLGKFGRPTKTVYVRLCIFIKPSRGKKKSNFGYIYVAKCNLIQWNCFEYSSGYL